MTGYGKATTHVGDDEYVIDIKALNARYCDLHLRLASEVRPLEPTLRARLTERLERGKIDLSIYRNTGAARAETINREVVNDYLVQLRDIATRQGLDPAPMTQGLLHWPQVFSQEQTDLSDDQATALFEALDTALGEVDAFRRQEGQALADDLLARVDAIEEAMRAVEATDADRVQTRRDRLRAELDQLQQDVDENRFEQEMIYYLEKYDITEEITRLANHCAYFRETVTTGGACGKKLNFIGQEMGREINTIGSKANASDLQKVVVGMKDELEKIKEQVNNVL